MRKLFVIIAIGLALLFQDPIARGDVGGEMPGPGLCEYPGVGGSGAAFGEYDYNCAFPAEINGSHWQCLYGGAMYQGTGGVSFMFVNASITTPLGVLRGACWWACPDATLSAAEQPNPPGAWKAEIHPPKCKPIGPAPIPVGAPEPPTAPPIPLPVPVQPAPQTGSVTDPVPPDPLGTSNSGH